MAAQLTRELLSRFFCSLQQGDLRFKGMNFMERRRVIKQAADIAMASAAPGARWSHALISKNVPTVATGIAAKQKHALFGTKRPGMGLLKRQRKRKVLDRYAICRRQSNSRMNKAERLARQHQKLGKLVPGGEFMGRVSLLNETAAYIVALKTQVRMMNYIVNVFEHLNEIGREDSPLVSACFKQDMEKQEE